MLSGSFLTKTVTGLVVRRILKEHIFPIPVVSKLTMVYQNPGSAIPRKLRLALCLNALKVKTGPENRMQVFTIVWGYYISFESAPNGLPREKVYLVETHST